MKISLRPPPVNLIIMNENKKPEGLKRKFYFSWHPSYWGEVHIYLGKPYDEYCLNFDLAFIGFGYAY